MNALKLQRKTLRTAFTNSTKAIGDELAKTDVDIGRLKELSTQLSDKYERLETVQRSISDILINESSESDGKDYEKDFIESENYRDQYLSFKSKLNRYENENDNAGESIKSVSNRKYRLPKLELQKFNGDIKCFLGFWSQFSRIHDDEEMPQEDKFQYLLQAMTPGSRAASLIQSFPATAQNYLKAVELLKERFGREDLLVQVYVRELLKMVMKNATTGRKCSDLTVLYDQLESHLRALDTLGRSKEKFADFLSPLVESCLPEDVLRAWERYRVSRVPNDAESSQRSLEMLMNFLRQEVNGEEMISLARSGFGSQTKCKKDTSESTSYESPSASALISSTPVRNRCVFCDNFHLSQECNKISSMSGEERKTAVIRKGLCLVCLRNGHMAKKCHSNVRCVICSRRHYAILCPEVNKAGTNNKTITKKENTSTLFVEPSSHGEIYLKTIIVRIKNEGQSHYVRVLLDDGSHRSYIENDLAKELKLSPCGKEVLAQGLFGGKQTPEEEHLRYSVNIESINRKFSRNVSLLSQPKICTNLPRVRDTNLLSELKSRGIVLTDIGRDTPPIRMLLGADVLGCILTGRVEVLKSGISAVETFLGWSILGCERKNTVVSMVSLCLQNSEIPKLWDLETLGIKDPVERRTTKLLEEETLTQFRETITKTDRRYEVALPWLTGHPAVYDRADVAETRLRSVTKRLLKENNYEAYDNIFKQWQAEGIVEIVPNDEILRATCHYLPHRPVIKLSSSTTKIRPVFDASFKRPGYASLNECLSVGPSLSEQIFPLLLRFRMEAIGVIADIKQAFLQLSIRPEDRDYLRFLWWKNNDQSELQNFRHCRVVFGVTSSPFLLNASISHHLNSEEFKDESLQPTLEKLKKGFYVDNLTTSVEDKERLEQFKDQALRIMSKGSFELRCWAYNGVKDEKHQSVLGLKWNTESDELYCVAPDIDVNVNGNVTKRRLLSICNSIYDPIGFTSPATLFPKLLLQESWKRKLDWDEEVPADIQLRYKQWVKHLELVEQCKIPRRMFVGPVEGATLHVFTDASANGYACCIFLRCDQGTEVKISLVSAKARVPPVQRPTIPRLELLGAAVGARMAATVSESLQLPLKTFFWTDSMIVLAWITKQEPWNSFVGNRVKEIRDLTNIEDWRHIPGEMNPADLPSRSCDWSTLLRSQWWEGPKWLRDQPEFWPHSEITLPDEAMVERRQTVATNINIATEGKFSSNFLYFSSYPKILRMMAWILRFIHNSREPSQKLRKELSCNEIQRAEKSLIRMIQDEWPQKEREKYGRNIQFYEDHQVLKVQSRLVLGSDPEDFIRPAVLPDHPIVRRMIEYVHKTLLHTGMLATLTKIRENFWIPRGRRVVKEVLQKCVICKRHSSKPVTPIVSPPLPVDRINRVAAFQVIGVDLAGPVYLRGGTKAWIVVFTCAVYRAIHLELVTSLSTEVFLQAMRRFISRRGRCCVVYSDNGTNFWGTSRALSTLNWQKIEEECAVQKIKWHFNPPAAPWYGGWWERMISTIKQLLRKSLGRACLTYEEMTTLLCECESVVNGRPLTYVSDNPNELRPLRPVDFIQDLKGNETDDLDIVDTKHLRKRIRYIQSVRCNLRRRFQQEYLSELIKNPQLCKKQQNLVPGDVVIIGSDNAKRLNWPLGRILEIFPGKDKIERVVKVRVASGNIIRPIQRIYPLELSPTEIPRCENRSSQMDFDISESSPSVTPDVLESRTDIPQQNPTAIKTFEREPKTASPTPAIRTRRGRKVIPLKRLNL